MTHIHDQILPEGTQIGVYEIKDALKIGAFDITYRAWNHHLKEQVEIQEYFPCDFAIRAGNGLSVEPKSPDDKENFDFGLKVFLDQTEMLTQLEHPNIAAVENVLQFNGTAYLIMGCPEGMPLSRLVQSFPSLADTELKFILGAMLQALQKVHEFKIVHGGIQPETIFLRKNGEPLLTHFAAARLAIAARISRLSDELTSGYAAAEQYDQARESGPATDFYALGVTLYYCMTHQQPVAAQSRIAALSKGEPDPMALRPEAVGTAYSAELLQAIEWMLRPDYNDRPQSAADILALLKSTQIHEQGKSVIPPPVATEVTESKPVARHYVGIGVMVGVIAVIAVGYWFSQKTTEPIIDDLSTIGAQTSSEHFADQTTIPEVSENEAMALAFVPPSPPVNDLVADSASSSPSPLVAESEAKDITAMEPDEAQQLAAIVPPFQPEEQKVAEKTIGEDAIKAHLAAAEKAMRAERLTTPRKDNAFKYYQRVLEADPDNAEALAGLQKIVNRYVQFIAKARVDGKLNEARLYLQRAESVLPDDPELHRIRAELAVAKK